ncbi:hypothetical protein B0H16DRAFT_1600850 [Mycena metata]|uniref:Secreted protein n=1 Tax=Mycena metata TaxID=1033252 RepID=A0AAD7HJG7_9AGAR|nr:hypothetical protein B0H16DRAFT_1600850 [Mycena metata]
MHLYSLLVQLVVAFPPYCVRTREVFTFKWKNNVNSKKRPGKVPQCSKFCNRNLKCYLTYIFVRVLNCCEAKKKFTNLVENRVVS